MATWIQGNQTTAAGSTSPATLKFTTQNTAAGSMLCAVVRCNNTATLTGVSDDQSAGNLYTVVQVGAPGTAKVYFVYALNTLGGTEPTLSFVFSGTVGGVVIAMNEYAKAAAFTLRTSVTTSTATGTNPTSGSFTPTIGDLIVVVLGQQVGYLTAGLTAGTVGSGATLRNTGTVSPNSFCAMEDGVANSGSSQTGSYTDATSNTYAIGAFVFAPPASGVPNGLMMAGAGV